MPTISLERGAVAMIDRPHDAVLYRGRQGAVTAAAFMHDAMRCAALLSDAGHVVNCCTNRYWFAVGFAAALLRGQVTLLTGDHSRQAMGVLAGRFGNIAAITDNVAFDTPFCRTLIGPAASAAQSAPAGMPRIEAERVVAIAFTSGSTGEPVGTAKRFGELAARTRAAGLRFGLNENNAATMIATVPPHHMYGFETTILLPWHTGAASWCEQVFYPADLQAALQDCPGRTTLVTTPLHLRGMLAMPGTARPPSAVISATAPLDANLAARAESLWQAELHEIFGATEVGSIASRRTVVDTLWSLYPGVTLTGADDAVVSAPGAPLSRLNDVVELLADGTHFRLLGRSSDMVKLGGRRASLAGLTQALASVPGVQDAVFVAPDDLETRPTARLLALAVCPGLDEGEILKSLRGKIDPLFMPRPLVCVPSLPRNALGKLPRQALLDLAAQHARAPRSRVSG